VLPKDIRKEYRINSVREKIRGMENRDRIVIISRKPQKKKSSTWRGRIILKVILRISRTKEVHKTDVR
jgi:hypothetical protein